MTLYDIELLFEEYHISFDRNTNVAYMSEPDDEWQSEVWSVYVKNIPVIANQTTCIFDDEDIMFQFEVRYRLGTISSGCMTVGNMVSWYPNISALSGYIQAFRNYLQGGDLVAPSITSVNDWVCCNALSTDSIRECIKRHVDILKSIDDVFFKSVFDKAKEWREALDAETNKKVRIEMIDKFSEIIHRKMTIMLE